MNFEKFESLQKLELGKFVAAVVKNEELDESILNYYRSFSSKLDGPHIEMLAVLLGELGTPAALSEVTQLLEHPKKYVRYQAAEVLSRAPALSTEIIAKLEQILKNPNYSEELKHLRKLLE